MENEDSSNRLRAGYEAWLAAGGQRKDPIEKLAENPKSLRLAVSAKCFDCCGRGADPGWRWQIGNCEVDCPLHAVRPYQNLEGKPMPAALDE